MSDLGHPDGHRRPFRGRRRRVVLLTQRIGGPLAAEAVIAELRMEGESETGAQLQLDVSWEGRPLPGAPAVAPGVRMARSTDSIVVHDLGLAKAVLGRAHDELRRGEVPDLRALARAAADRE